MIFEVHRIRENAKLPVKAHSSDAGWDLFYCPSEEKDLEIKPGESALIPTGIKLSFPNHYMIEIKNKGGIAAKQQLIVGSCVVDSGYTGEVFVNLHNIGQIIRTIEPGNKVAQMVPICIGQCLMQEVEEYKKETDRGEGCLGSTGDK
jgi:dUTP pyrophosphatase